MGATYRIGTFVWRELMTNDVDAAVRFYTEVFGWSIERGDKNDYLHVNAGDVPVGGIMPLPPGMPMPPMWAGYVSVADVDAAAKVAKENGGQVVVGPKDIPHVGRFAGVVDPTGAYLNLFRSERGDDEAPFPPGAGQFCWETISSTDPAKAKAFYEKVLGWKIDPSAKMEAFRNGENLVADVQSAQPNVPSHWMSFVVVLDRSAALDRVKRLGGSVLVERIDIPEIGQIAVIQDPQGATIGLFEEPRR